MNKLECNIYDIGSIGYQNTIRHHSGDKVVVTSCCNWTEVLSGLYISSGLLNAHQGKEKPYKSV